MKQTLLLVDDNQEMLEVLKDELSEKYKIITALNGKMVLDILTKEYIHLIISDIMMPVMDGFELCDLIKSNPYYHHIPIILLTARNSLQSRIEGLEKGADAYIEKPFDVDHLHAQINNLLTNRNKIKAHFSNTNITGNAGSSPLRSDEQFKENINEVISSNMEDLQLDVNKLAKLMNMSRTNLFRKVKQVFDQTPNDLIKIIRLRKAAELLVTTDHKMYEICDMVGFGTQTNFGRSFFRQYGSTPTDFQKQARAGKAGMADVEMAGTAAIIQAQYYPSYYS